MKTSSDRSNNGQSKAAANTEQEGRRNLSQPARQLRAVHPFFSDTEAIDTLPAAATQSVIRSFEHPSGSDPGTAPGRGIVQRAAPAPVVAEQTGFMSDYHDSDSVGVVLKKIKENEFLLKGKIVKWNGAAYTNSAGAVIVLTEANAALEQDADVLDITQGEIGHLPNATGALKKIRSTNASPCVIVTIHDTATRQTMMTHIHRKNNVADFVAKAVTAFGADNDHLEIKIRTLLYVSDNADRQEDERTKQQGIIDKIKGQTQDSFDMVTDDNITEDTARENAMISTTDGVVTHPADGAVERDRGALGVKRASAVERGWGEAPADNSKAFTTTRTANVMAHDAAALQAKKAETGPAFSRMPVQLKASSVNTSAGVVQRVWVPVTDTKLKWDPVKDGLQWFYNTTTKKMHYEIRLPALEDVPKISDNERTPKLYNEWIKAGWFHEQDPREWEAAGWNLNAPIEVTLGDTVVILPRGTIHIVGVDHREQDLFLNVMRSLTGEDVLFLNEGFNSDDNQDLPQHEFGLEEKAEKIGGMATLAAFFIQRNLLGAKESELKEHHDLVIPKINSVLNTVMTDKSFADQLASVEGKGLLMDTFMAAQDKERGAPTLKFLLSVASGCTKLIAAKTPVPGGFVNNFQAAAFAEKAKDGKFIKGDVMNQMNELREVAMTGNISRASSPANAVVVLVGEEHVESLMAKVPGRVRPYKGYLDFLASNKRS